jgi:hypothetical protein
MQIHFIDIIAIGDVESGCLLVESTRATRWRWRWKSEMSQSAAAISLEQDTPELARNYEKAGIVQFHHGKFLGATDEQLKELFTTAGFVDYRSDLRSLVGVHSDADSLLRWSEASAFGNFLDGFSRSESDQVRRAFTGLVEAKRTPEGLRLERYLRFAFARKAPSTNALGSST